MRFHLINSSLTCFRHKIFKLCSLEHWINGATYVIGIGRVDGPCHDAGFNRFHLLAFKLDSGEGNPYSLFQQITGPAPSGSD